MLEKIWPMSFTHWKIKSTKRNAVLCKVTRGFEELGLYWKFQSPNPKFDYFPAVVPRDENGQIKAEPFWEATKWQRDGTRDRCDFDFNFREGEAKINAELLKQIDRGTEDYDDTIFVEKFEPHLLARLIPIFALAVWLVIIWALYLAFWKR
jgi:hypothetical protein